MNTKRKEYTMPLWHLELRLEQARRRFAVAEAAYRKAERDVEQLRKEVELQRSRDKW